MAQMQAEQERSKQDPERRRLQRPRAPEVPPLPPLPEQ